MTAKHVNPWLVLCLVCVAQFMVILDATIVNVALPSIQADLEMAEADLQWIVNAYTAASFSCAAGPATCSVASVSSSRASSSAPARRS